MVNVSIGTNEQQYTLQKDGTEKPSGSYKIMCLLTVAGLLFKGLLHSTDVIGVLLVLTFLNLRAVSEIFVEQIPPSTCLYAAGSVIVQVLLAVVRSQAHHVKFSNSRVDINQTSFLKPNLFPCRTTHTRMFPTKHSFSYSYLMVGVPIGWNGSNAMLSTDAAGEQNSWFKVHSDDYLARGHHDGGLAGKLRAYLTSQNVSLDQYEFAYLITAPRFLGFSFNPISFWYLYDRDCQLSAMILEVNNTFDERRMYLLQRPENVKSGDTFASEWDKDFHVSPFNDRDGSYSVTVRDLMHSTGEVMVDNNIVLRSNESKPKIVARIFSTQNAIETTSMTMLERLTFVAKWWWVGFMTNPRILREARILWVKKLQVFYRPEVLRTSIGRSESIEEIMLEGLFRKLLKFLADTSKHIEISYIPAAGPDNGTSVTIKPETQSTSEDCKQPLSLKVLTPAFYAEIVRTQSLLDAFERFCFHPNSGEAMLVTSEAGKLQTLLEGVTSLQGFTPKSRREVFVVCLRQQGVWSTLVSSVYLSDHHNLKLSQLDVLIKSHCSATTYQEYLFTALRILLADRLAFGLMPLLTAYFRIARYIIWIVLALMASRMYSAI